MENNQQNCKAHPSKIVAYSCLDCSCTRATRVFCSTCKKKHHSECKKELVIKHSHFDDLTEIIDDCPDLGEEQSSFDSIIQETLKLYKKQLIKLKDKLLYTKKGKILFNIHKTKDIKKVQQFYDIAYDDEEEKLKFKLKHSQANQKQFKEVIDQLELNIKMSLSQARKALRILMIAKTHSQAFLKWI